jgi:hypothetical protein
MSGVHARVQCKYRGVRPVRRGSRVRIASAVPNRGSALLRQRTLRRLLGDQCHGLYWGQAGLRRDGSSMRPMHGRRSVFRGRADLRCIGFHLHHGLQGRLGLRRDGLGTHLRRQVVHQRLSQPGRQRLCNRPGVLDQHGSSGNLQADCRRCGHCRHQRGSSFPGCERGRRREPHLSRRGQGRRAFVLLDRPSSN